ncbi:MAG: hypothetical protein C4K49_09415 [Candidatus Thorarchaeota archaeon]|nr:MAG: hypothetical protein C4K49_09415 [Candidatus Thorarchaeota archaeon]
MLAFLSPAGLVCPGASGQDPDTPKGLALPSQRVYGADFSKEVFDAVSEGICNQLVVDLTAYGPRPSSSSANEQARSWIQDQLRSVSNGRIQVEVLGGRMSVVGRLPGWVPQPAPAFIVGGHYDTVSVSPGANDDAVGVAAMLEVARVMSPYEWPLDIYFCAWNAEEIGLLGSNEAAAILNARGVSILQYFNIDMLLVADNEALSDARVLVAYNKDSEATYQDSQYYAELMKMMSNNLGTSLIKTVSSKSASFWWASDHASFIGNGYEQVLFAFESGADSDDAYHTSADTWDNPSYNFTLAQETSASIAASMAFTMAHSYGEPANLMATDVISRYGSETYYVAITTPTVLAVTACWSLGSPQFTLYAPSGTLLETFLGNAPQLNQTVFNVTVATNGLYRLKVSNPNGSQSSVQTKIQYDTDIEGDGISDRYQYWTLTGLYNTDSDGDSLNDAYEIIIGTLPMNPDSDSDSLPDGWEITNGFNPLVPDSLLDPDGDGLNNLYEFRNGTDPRNNDSEFDGMPDGWEVEYGLDPLFDDSAFDADMDGITNLEEYLMGLDPQVSDMRTSGIYTDVAIPIALIGFISTAAVAASWLARKNWKT